MFLYVNTDGGCLDNTIKPPGLASAAYVARGADGIYLGSRSEIFKGTNNDAEYRGLLLALKDLPSYSGVEGVHIRCDSKLIVYQIGGEFRSKDERMKAYQKEVLDLINKLPYHCSITLIGRESNKEADWLCTHAMYMGPKLEQFAEMPEKTSRNRLKKETA